MKIDVYFQSSGLTCFIKYFLEMIETGWCLFFFLSALTSVDQNTYLVGITANQGFVPAVWEPVQSVAWFPVLAKITVT
jgi:hypothetical protein